MTQTAHDEQTQIVDLTTVDEQLAEHVPGWLATLDQLTAFIEEKEEEIAEAKVRQKRFSDLLKLAGHDTTKRKSQKKEPKPSPESVERLVRWLAEQSEPKSYPDIEEALGMSNSTANKQIKVARDVGLVAVAHMGGETGRMMYFTVFDNAIAQLDRGDVRWP